jgi:DNA-binding FadR family transcriptional regulator
MPLSQMQFQPRNINAQLVDTIGRRILSGHYQVGEKLPIESELCEEFGVSRPIVREAVKMLMAKGLLNSRPRVGTLVTERKNWNMLDPHVLNWIIHSLPEHQFLDMLFEVRSAIEPTASALAAKNATEQDRSALVQAYVDMAAAKSPAELAEPDIRFHQAIMDATDNAMLSYIGYTLHEALSFSIKLTSRHPDTHELSLPRHKAVLDAICEGDEKAARIATEVLLHESRKDFDSI